MLAPNNKQRKTRLQVGGYGLEGAIRTPPRGASLASRSPALDPGQCNRSGHGGSDRDSEDLDRRRYHPGPQWAKGGKCRRWRSSCLHSLSFTSSLMFIAIAVFSKRPTEALTTQRWSVSLSAWRLRRMYGAAGPHRMPMAAGINTGGVAGTGCASFFGYPPPVDAPQPRWHRRQAVGQVESGWKPRVPYVWVVWFAAAAVIALQYWFRAENLALGHRRWIFGRLVDSASPARLHSVPPGVGGARVSNGSSACSDYGNAWRGSSWSSSSGSSGGDSVAAIRAVAATRRRGSGRASERGASAATFSAQRWSRFTSLAPAPFSADRADTPGYASQRRRVTLDVAELLVRRTKCRAGRTLSSSLLADRMPRRPSPPATLQDAAVVGVFSVRRWCSARRA